MAFRVLMVPAALRDVEGIHAYILANSGAIAAGGVFGEIEKRVANLATMPERGNVPKELAALGRCDYRELHCKPYRIFYRVSKPLVVVMAVLDGRRDMSMLLHQRLTR